MWRSERGEIGVYSGTNLENLGISIFILNFTCVTILVMIYIICKGNERKITKEE